MEEFLKTFSRREFLNVYSKENMKHLFKAFKTYKEGVEEKSRRSCDEVAKMFFKKRASSSSQIKKGGT